MRRAAAGDPSTVPFVAFAMQPTLAVRRFCRQSGAPSEQAQTNGFSQRRQSGSTRGSGAASRPVRCVGPSALLRAGHGVEPHHTTATEGTPDAARGCEERPASTRGIGVRRPHATRRRAPRVERRHRPGRASSEERAMTADSIHRRGIRRVAATTRPQRPTSRSIPPHRLVGRAGSGISCRRLSLTNSLPRISLHSAIFIISCAQTTPR